MAKKKEEKWVRLSNGSIERDSSVGPIMLHLRSIAMNSPAQYELLARFSAELETDLPDYLVAKLRSLKFIKPGDDEVVLYDDVRDVIDCCAQWTGEKVRFDSNSLLHVDQTKIVPPEDEE